MGENTEIGQWGVQQKQWERGHRQGMERGTENQGNGALGC